MISIATEIEGKFGKRSAHQQVKVHVTVTQMTPTDWTVELCQRSICSEVRSDRCSSSDTEEPADLTVELYQWSICSAARLGRCSHVSSNVRMQNDWQMEVREKGRNMNQDGSHD